MNFGTVERQIECLSVSDFGVCGDTYRKVLLRSLVPRLERKSAKVSEFWHGGAPNRVFVRQ